MAQLTVRNIDDSIAAALKLRAMKAGRSAEAEHRKILQDVLQPAQQGNFFETARARRIKLPPEIQSTTELLREDRGRDDDRA